MDTPMPVPMVDTGPMVPTPLPTDTPMPVSMVDRDTARGPLMLSPRLRLMLRLIPPFSMALMDIPMLVSMVDTGPMVPTPLPTDMDTEPMEPTPTLTTERGPLMLSLRLMLRPILLSSMAPMDIPMPVSTVDTEPMVPTLLPTDMDTEPMEPTPIHTTARGRLMLRPIPLFSMVPMDIPMPVPMVDTGPMVPTPLPTDMDTEPMEPTPILTTERGPLMLSPRLRPRLTPPSSTPPPMLSLPRSLTPASPRSTP